MMGYSGLYKGTRGAKEMKESKDIDFFNAMAKKFNFTKDELKNINIKHTFL